MAALRSVLPAGVRWSAGLPLVAFAFAAGLGVTGLAVAASLPRRRRWADAHWTERARATRPGRRAAAFTSVLSACLLGPLAAAQAGAVAALPPAGLGIAASVAAWLGGVWVAARVSGRVFSERRTFLGQARAWLALVLLLCPQAFVIVTMIFCVHASWETGNLLFAGAGVAAFVCFSIWGGWTPSREAAPAPTSGAAAASRRRRARLDASLDDAALEAVAAHELGHLAEPRRMQWLRLAAALAWLPVCFLTALSETVGFAKALVLVYGFGFAVMIPVLRLRRHMEERADALARRHEAKPGALARALERLYELNLVPVVTRKRRGSHPDLRDRLAAAGVAPSWPIPKPPSRLRGALGIGVGAVALVVVAAAQLVGTSFAVRAIAADRTERALARIALTGGRSSDFFDVGLGYMQQGRTQDARALFEGVTVLDPGNQAARACAEKLRAAEDPTADYAPDRRRR